MTTNTSLTTRWVEFTFAQIFPAVCLPCKQTDLVQRFYHVF